MPDRFDSDFPDALGLTILMDYATIFLLILALSFSLAALILTRHSCRIVHQDYLRNFYFKLWVDLAYTATSSTFMLAGADLNLSSGRLAFRIGLALLPPLGMALICADSYFHAQACLNLVGRSLNRPYRLFLFILFLTSLILIALFLSFLKVRTEKTASICFSILLSQ